MSAPGRPNLQPSVIDRLIDPALRENLAAAGYTVKQMYAAVLRDLEDLLNSRRALRGEEMSLPEVADSVAAYGLPDLASLEGASREQRRQLGEHVRRVINRFEPRLKDVAVRLSGDEADESRGAVRFEVDARLRADPAPDVAFETVLEIASGHFQVKDKSA